MWMSNNSLNRGQIEAAASGDQVALRQVLLQLMANQAQNNVATGQSTLKKLDNQPPSFNQPPSIAGLSVVGQDGNFTVTITNPQQVQPASVALLKQSAATQPNTQNAQIFHEISSSTTPQFNDEGDVITNPASTSLHYVFPLPIQTRYWRIRSSYDQKAWNSYRLFTTSSGPTAVSSGSLSSGTAANSLSLNQTNFANVDSIAAGASATVRVYNSISGPYKSWVRAVGASSSVQPSATILNVPYNTTQYVAYSPSQGMFQIQSQLAQVLPDGYVPAGKVPVVGSGPITLPVVTLIINNGFIIGVSFTPGSGLTQDPVYTVNPGTSLGAGGALKGTGVSGGMETGIDVTNSGNGKYDGTASVTASGGVFSGATGGGGPTGQNTGRLYGGTV
jgi:hypothetical protein